MEKQIEIEVEGQKIFGILHLPESSSREKSSLVIISHGWASRKTGPGNRFFVTAARKLCNDDFAVFRFGFRGSGDSEGKFKEQTTTSMLEDLERVIGKVSELKGIDRSSIALIGHSQGGYISLLEASENEKIKALVLWMGRVSDLKDFWGEPWENELRRKGYYVSEDYRVTEEYYEDSLDYNSKEAIQNLNVPVGMIYGEMDNKVPPSEGLKLKENFNGKSELETLKYLNHYFHGEKSKEKVVEKTKEWLNSWL